MMPLQTLVNPKVRGITAENKYKYINYDYTDWKVCAVWSEMKIFNTYQFSRSSYGIITIPDLLP
jgi:hypothetical protein